MAKTSALSSSIKSIDDLVVGDILPSASAEMHAVASQFSVSITPAMLSLIDTQDKNDPIAAQFVPSAQELSVLEAELADPIGDKIHSPVDGIVHRYPDRILLKLLHTCPVYCRFCFRREQVGKNDGMLSPEKLTQALDYIRSHSEIWEVILSGGDPLMLSDRRLADVVAALNDIPHVKILRIHTRLPVVDPARITPELITAVRGRMATYVLLHCNHARELTEEARTACARLVDAGFPMLSQSVLLRGVNDTVENLENLMRAFVETRIKPHYLYQLDLARGTNHFRVPIKEGQSLLRKMRGKISGMCQPTYMLDLPNGHGKTPIGPIFAVENEEGWLIEDFRQCQHNYQEPK